MVVLPHSLTVRLDAEGHPVVGIVVDLSPAQITAALQALRTIRETRYRTVEVSADDVIAMREVTSLIDELDDVAGADGYVRLEATVARIGVLRSALSEFAAAEHLEREGDAEARPAIYTLLDGLDEIYAEAVRAALDGTPALS